MTRLAVCRDIKSSNIMLTRAQGHRIIKVRLCDPYVSVTLNVLRCSRP